MKTLNILIFLLVVSTFSLFAYVYTDITGRVVIERETAFFVRSIDGDTIVVSIDNKEEKVRLLGINTPEKSMPGYKEALSLFESISPDQIVELEKGDEDADKYNRKLRYVFYNNILLNEESLRKGLSTTYYYSEDQYTKRLTRAEQEAITEQVGLWQKSSDLCADCMSLKNIDNGKGKDDCKPATESILLINKCSFSCSLNKWYIHDDANKVFTFTDTELSPQETITIFNGEGKDNETSSFFNNKGCASIWNDAGDTLFLRDPSGKLVFFKRY